MKFQAPHGVTALFCAGEEIFPDARGCFEAAEILASELLAHGCIPEAQSQTQAESTPVKKRGRAEKAS